MSNYLSLMARVCGTKSELTSSHTHVSCVTNSNLTCHSVMRSCISDHLSSWMSWTSTSWFILSSQIHKQATFSQSQFHTNVIPTNHTSVLSVVIDIAQLLVGRLTLCAIHTWGLSAAVCVINSFGLGGGCWHTQSRNVRDSEYSSVSYAAFTQSTLT